MTWHDQKMARTNAANVFAAQKYLKPVRERCKIHYKHEEQTARLFSTASHVSDEKRKGGWCWLLYDDWNREMASNAK